jgi:hypothetical protein
MYDHGPGIGSALKAVTSSLLRGKGETELSGIDNLYVIQRQKTN